MKTYIKHFFKYEGDSFFVLQNYPKSTGKFSLAHIIFLCLVFVLIPLLCYVLRNLKKQNILTLLKISAIFWISLEIIKLMRIFHFNNSDIIKELPIQLCSLFLYCLFFSAFFKGKICEASNYFLSTMGIICGLMGLLFPTIFTRYPFFHFNSLHSMLYHAYMMFIGLLLLSTEYVKLQFKNAKLNFIFIIPAYIISIIVNETTVGTNYIFLKTGKGTPLSMLDFLPHSIYALSILILLFILNYLLFLPIYIVEKRTLKNNKSQLSSP